MSNIRNGFIVLIGGVIGELIVRINYLNGSLDKPWLMAFLLPPLSIISSIFYFTGFVKKGVGSDPWDHFVMIIPFLTFIFDLMVDNLCEFSVLIQVSIQCLIFTMARFYRKGKECKDYPVNPGMEYSFDQAMFILIIIRICVFVSGFISYIPYIGLLFLPWDFLGFIPGLQTGIIMTTAHLILNMQGNTTNANHKQEMCTGEVKLLPKNKFSFKEWRKAPISKFFILVIVTFILNTIGDFLP